MRYIEEYKAYKLYEVSNDDIEITGSTGSRYIRNSILIFSSSQLKLKLGNEKYQEENLKKAKELIDKNENLISIQERLKSAEVQCKIRKEQIEIIKHNSLIENKKRDVERRYDIMQKNNR